MDKRTAVASEEKKSTSLSKFLRILRIQNDQLLGDMAEKLGIKPSYLSSIEANRRPLTPELRHRLVEAYGLDETAQVELEKCTAQAARSVEVSLLTVRNEERLPEYVDTALLFARDLSSLGSAELAEIRNLLYSFKEEHTDEKRTIHKSKIAAAQ